MMTCANCGHTQATGAFCEACGTKLPAVAAAAPAAVATSTPPPAPTAAAAGAIPTPPTAPTVAAPAAGQAGAAPQPRPPPPGGYGDLGTKGFWGRFFDLSFREFVTPSIIRVLFILFVVVIGLGFVGGVVNGFLWSPALGVTALIGGIIWGFVSLILARVFLEIIIVFFHIHDNTKEIAKGKR